MAKMEAAGALEKQPAGNHDTNILSKAEWIRTGSSTVRPLICPKCLTIVNVPEKLHAMLCHLYRERREREGKRCK